MNGRMGKIDSAQLNKQQQQFAEWNFISDKLYIVGNVPSFNLVWFQGRYRSILKA